jgi:type II secretory pathway component PulM
MATTFVELLEWLKQLDEVYLLEILEISAEDLIAAFMDKIEDKQDLLKREIEL